MNVHIKPLSPEEPYPAEMIGKIVALVRRYHCEKYVYFMIVSDDIIRQFKTYAPDIPVCVGHWPDRAWQIVDRAIELGCEKVQLYMEYYNQEMIDKAHAHGIRCNYCGTDDPQTAKKLIAMGVDTILTNEYLTVSEAVRR